MDSPPTTSADPLVGRLLEGRYRLDAALARGGMATVYAATDTRLDRGVAVKVMHRALADDPEFVARFTREARAAARLSSAEVVAVHDQGTDDATGLAYLVMEHVRGGTLRDLLRAQGAQSPARAVALVEPVLRALAAAHAAGLVHRDVKPENVLLAEDGRIKVADFGLARAVEASTLTATTGLMMGTAAYMAPEQVDTGHADPRSDVYAAGVVLWELLTGTPPYGGDSHVRVAYRHVHEDVPPPSTVVAGLSPALDELVVRATRRQPSARPVDGGAFLAELRAVREGMPAVPAQPDHLTLALSSTLVVPRPTDPTDPDAAADPADPALVTSSRRPRRGVVVAVLVALATVAALLGGWYLGGRSTPVPAVLGVTAEIAREQLEAAGFTVSTTQDFSETAAPGTVAEQSPEPREDARVGSTVELVLSRGPDRRVLPTLVGLSQEAATERITGVGLRVGTVVRAFSDELVGQVVAVGAPAGTRLRPGSPVNLTVSKGVELLDVPSAVGRGRAAAGQLLEAAGFAVTSEEVFSDTVPSGTVVAQDPPGGRLQRGGSVALQVSKGPERVVVPDLSGLSDKQAKAAAGRGGAEGQERAVVPVRRRHGRRAEAGSRHPGTAGFDGHLPLDLTALPRPPGTWHTPSVPPRKPSPVGSHVPVAGGLTKGLDYAQEIGARAVQVFVSNPRGWAPSAGDPAQDALFRGRCADEGIPAFVHAPYLINFGSPTEATLGKSVAALSHALGRAAAIGASGVVVHAGSAVAGAHREDAMDQLREHLLPVLDTLEPDGPRLLVEPTAGGGQALAATVQDLGPWFARLEDHPMLGVCLDTCHAFAAGHDLAAPGGMKRTLDALVKTVGRGRLALVHANDSKDPLGSSRDRHEAIGQGLIGKDPFTELFRHPATRGVPVLIETPGDAASHRRDVDLLCALRDG